MAAALALPASMKASPDDSTARPVRFATGAQWTGAAALAGGKGYAPCRLGQMHYRDLGPSGATPFLLIPQAPQFMVEFADVQPRITAAGRRSIAVDTPGFGLSDPAPVGVAIPDLADNLVGLLDHLRIAQVVLAGHHTGASIAAAFAARHPDRTAGVVLHGVPLYTSRERAERLAQPPANLQLTSDGLEFSRMYEAIYKIMGAHRTDLVSAAWATIGEFLAGPGLPAYRAVFSHDLRPDLLAIRAPTLILSDSADTLNVNDRRAASLRPDFTLHVFSNGTSSALSEHPARWADLVMAFASHHGL